jgi:hypothetical protein
MFYFQTAASQNLMRSVNKIQEGAPSGSNIVRGLLVSLAASFPHRVKRKQEKRQTSILS